MKSNNDPVKSNANYKQNKILFIDDNDDHWDLIRSTLNQCLPLATIVRAASSQQAQTLLEQWQYQEWEHPKLILLDLYLPENQDGWNLLEQIKAMPAPLSKIPVVMFSSSDSRADIRTAYQLGVSAYMIKPVSFEDWLSHFQTFCLYWWKTASLLPTQYTF